MLITQLVQVEDPEQILREKTQKHGRTSQTRQRNPRETRDSDGEEYSEAEEVNI